MPNIYRLCLLVLICGCIQACFFDEAGGDAGASFQDDISPLLLINCATAGCHDADASSGGLNLALDEGQTPTDQYDEITNAALVDATMPETSVLLLQAANADPNDPHDGGVVFAQGSTEYNQILTWIQEGAINDDCTGVDHGFSADVIPALSSCTGSGCHDGTASPNFLDQPYNAASGVVNVDNPAQSLLLQNALGQNDHGGGTVFASASDEDYRTIFCWIQEDDAADN
jgi:hypothetical protein